MKTKSVSMVAIAISMGLALPVAAMAQDAGSGPAVQAPYQLPGTSGAPQAQVPQPQQDPGVNWKGVGVGAGTVVGNALYMPAKLVYGILGGIAGGAGWALTGGNTQVSNTIWRSSLGGDYVLTPNMVAGKEPVHFSGPIDTAVPPSPNDPSANAGGPSSMTASSATLAPVPAGTSSAPHPIDHGAGPIGGASSSGGPNSVSGPLPSTSIE
jgi:hypothetical protein